MKKNIISAMLLMHVALCAYAQSEAEGKAVKFDLKAVTFGVRTGCAVNAMQSITVRDDGSDTKTFEGVGWQVGGSAYYNIQTMAGISPQDHWGIETSLLFSNRMYYTGSYLNSLYYAELPVTLVYAYGIPFTKKLNIKWQLGPYFGVGLAGSNRAFANSIRRFNFGLTGGLGMEFGRFFVGSSYSYGALNVARNTSSKHTQRLNSSDLTIGWNF
ncbi:MAG: PorT family protein [Prevotellaceae bacterium]|jgi:hypothetical protein|nr:PorT family protein [Prevotellaceae bacterium]